MVEYNNIFKHGTIETIGICVPSDIAAQCENSMFEATVYSNDYDKKGMIFHSEICLYLGGLG